MTKLRVGPRLPNEPDFVEGKPDALSQADLGFVAGGIEPERLKAFEVDCTPGPVVRQMFEQWGVERSGLKILDLCAGSGVFGQQARDVLGDAIESLTAVEIRSEERPNLERWYDEVRIGDLREQTDLGEFDLIVGNPAFSFWLDALTLAQSVRVSHGAVVMLGLNELGTRGSASRGAWEKHPPAQQWRIAGTLGFRGPGKNPETGKRWGTDTRSYSWWVWRNPGVWGSTPGVWLARDLPPLSAQERTWRARPGTEER